MSETINNSQGCVLPESLRRYYLEVMGIQAWEQQFVTEAVVTEAVGTEAVSVNTSIENEQVAEETPSESDAWSLLQSKVASTLR